MVDQLQSENIGQVEEDLVLRVVDGRCCDVALDFSYNLDFACETPEVKDNFVSAAILSHPQECPRDEHLYI